jgi:hypothetical protein
MEETAPDRPRDSTLVGSVRRGGSWGLHREQTALSHSELSLCCIGIGEILKKDDHTHGQ